MDVWETVSGPFCMFIFVWLRVCNHVSDSVVLCLYTVDQVVDWTNIAVFFRATILQFHWDNVLIEPTAQVEIV